MDKKPQEVKPDTDQGERIKTNLLGGALSAALKGIVGAWGASKHVEARHGRSTKMFVAKDAAHRKTMNKMARKSRAVNRRRK